jgi:Flagellar biosynthesis pathway, component FlhB
VLYALIPMCIIAIVDLIYTRWKYQEDLKMTKSELKDEHKQADGDPMVKSKQRQQMNEVMRRRMMHDVPKADVIVTNPTHIAVALKYNALEAPAPVVVAKGADMVAERIKKIARENNVPIRENKPLARALYKDVDIGEMIPENLYQAVAAILASLNKFKKKARNLRYSAGQGNHRQVTDPNSLQRKIPQAWSWFYRSVKFMAKAAIQRIDYKNSRSRATYFLPQA